jgi:hypothetical protein
MGFLGTSFIFIVKSFLVLLSFGSESFCFKTNFATEVLALSLMLNSKMNLLSFGSTVLFFNPVGSVFDYISSSSLFKNQFEIFFIFIRGFAYY